MFPYAVYSAGPEYFNSTDAIDNTRLPSPRWYWVFLKCLLVRFITVAIHEYRNSVAEREIRKVSRRDLFDNEIKH